ncbi:hypothetical protein [Actinomyces trachealis]|uniref:hypothetical protein n=1 Tax=Actinomyces trachealis TaxID=2763540 RepID=UPI0018C6600F|nr:hypothetical protein [Actinomyces trachealis]
MRVEARSLALVAAGGAAGVGLRVLLGTGLLGGYSTFSTACVEGGTLGAGTQLGAAAAPRPVVDAGHAHGGLGRTAPGGGLLLRHTAPDRAAKGHSHNVRSLLPIALPVRQAETLG